VKRQQGFGFDSLSRRQFGFNGMPRQQFGPIFAPNGQVNLPPLQPSPLMRSGSRGYGFDRYGYGLGYRDIGPVGGGAPWERSYG
jgi:hypothetical protein